MGGEHKYEVSEEIIREAYGCLKKFDCLEGCADLCPVESRAMGEVLLIKSEEKKICNYRIGFGDDFICCCPVRKTLHKQFGV